MNTTFDEKLSVLIEGCRKENRESQRLLYKHFYGYAMSISLRYSKDYDEAVEIVNDSFMKVYTNLNKFDLSKPFKPWLRRIIINTALDYYRQHNKHYYHDDIENADVEYTATNILSDLAYQDILQLVQKLSPAYKAVFNLYAIDGYTHEEIAEQLNISVGTSKSNLFKARANLMEMLKKINVDAYSRPK